MISNAFLLSIIPPLLKGVLLTMHITIYALIIGFIGGIILGALNSRKLHIAGISHIINFYILLVRGTPLYVQVLIVYYALPDLLNINLSPFVAGVLAIGCNSIAYVGEIVRGGINAISDGQWQAGYVLGYSKLQAFIHLILPQVIKNCIPALTNECTALIKETSILAAIGVAEITHIAMNINAKELKPMPVYLLVALLYVMMTTGISIITKKIERII